MRLITVLGIVCMLFFVITKVNPVVESVTERDYRYGNLYDFSKVNRFKIAIPERIEDSAWITTNLNEAKIILIGDSFSDVNYGHAKLPQLIGELRKEKVFHLTYKDLYKDLPDLSDIDVSGKIVLFESTERFISLRYTNPTYYKESSADQGFKNLILSGYSNLFTQSERNYNYFIDHNVYLNEVGANAMWATLRFNISGNISATTPRYSLDPPMLFYHESVDHFYRNHPVSEIDNAAKGIMRLFDEIKDQGGVPIFIPIPEKFTIHHGMAGESKNSNYLPELQDRLKTEEIEFINLYSSLMNSDTIYYWPTDTHLSDQGFELLLKLIDKKI